MSSEPVFSAANPSAIPVTCCLAADAKAGLADLSDSAQAQAKGAGFTGKAGEMLRLSGSDGSTERVLFGLGDGRDPLALAGLSAKLDGGLYRLDGDMGNWPMETACTGWADGAYRFTRYKNPGTTLPKLAIDDETLRTRLIELTAAIDRLRDMVNTPAEHMGPSGIEAQVRDVADRFDAKVTVTVGDELVEQNYPLIHAVGRAAGDPPRLIELAWGEPDAPVLALVGKGVAFDSGGLNIKPGDSMRLMKKDMGGSAHALACAQLVMAMGLPVRLKLLIAAVENAIGPNAFRPSDIIASRKGLTVEIENTDAEGRLVLADALTRAQEDGTPDLVVDFATLTGAARVALGPEVMPFYTDAEDVASALSAAGERVGDPLWRMPLWHGYEHQLKSPIADLKNLGNGPMGGSITAALFLKNFVDIENWVHFDVWAWRLGKYGRPDGGAAQGLRAMFAVIEDRYSR